MTPAVAEVAPEPPFRAGKQVTLGLGLGFGAAGHSGTVCTNCDPERQGGGVEVRFGWMHSPRFAIVVELNADMQAIALDTGLPFANGTTLRQEALVVGVRGWVTRRAWVGGVGGVARAEVPPIFCESGPDAPPDGCDPIFEASGVAFAASAGVELVSRTSWALDLRGRLATGFYSDINFVSASLGVAFDLFL